MAGCRVKVKKVKNSKAEFHFGHLDRHKWGGGIRPTESVGVGVGCVGGG